MLNDVIKAYLSPDKKVSLQTALSSVENVDELATQATDRSKELDTKTVEELTDEEVVELEAIAEVLKTLRGIREQAAAEAYADAEEEAKKAQRAESVEQAKSAISELTTPPTPPAPVKEPEPESVPTAVAVEEEKPTMTPPPEAAPAAEAKELVSAGAPETFAVSSLPSAPPSGRPTGSMVGEQLTRMFSVDSGGASTDRRFGDMKEVGSALVSALQHRFGGFGKNVVAQYKRDDVDEFSVWSRDSDIEVIDRVVAKQPEWNKATQTFAAGWCAPSETLYELCPFVTSLDGIVDLPEIVARRGGVQTTNGPNFATLYADASIGQILTEAEVIAETPKTCIEIDCPPFTETRLDVNPLCITGNLLTQAGYPEYVERFIREAIAANEHKINLEILTRMATASTAVTLPGATGPVDTSSASWFLDAASLYATWLRDRYRLRQDALIEVVAPYWYFQQMTADLARRNGVDLLTGAARLNEAFADRNIRIQWVYDWQPMPATAAAAAARPTTANILVFIPGTFVKLTAPVINLGTIHSAAQLTLNQYTALFVEEGFNVLERCFESLLITVPTCPSGTTGAATGSCDSTP